MHVDCLVCVGLNKGVYRHRGVQAMYVDCNIFIKYVTKDVTIHLRIATILIISNVRFNVVMFGIILSSRRSRLRNGSYNLDS